VQQHHSIENIIQHMIKEKGDKFVLPDNFPFEEARNMFKDPQVAEGGELEFKWAGPHYEELKSWLVETHTFNADRVDNIIQRLKKAESKSGQMRLENLQAVEVLQPTPTHQRTASVQIPRDWDNYGRAMMKMEVSFAEFDKLDFGPFQVHVWGKQVHGDIVKFFVSGTQDAVLAVGAYVTKNTQPLPHKGTD